MQDCALSLRQQARLPATVPDTAVSIHPGLFTRGKKSQLYAICTP